MRNATLPGSVRTNVVELYRDEYATVVAEPDGLIVRIVRSSVPHPSPKVLEERYMQVALAVDRYGRSGRCLLVDTRDAQGQNAPEYADAFRRARIRNEAGFLRIAVLFRTAIGMLQLRRLSDEDGSFRLITTNEPDAIAYLRHGVVPTEVRLPTGKNESKR